MRIQKTIEHIREQEMPLQYKGFDIRTRRVDFFIEDKIMLEIKAVKELEDVHLAQVINYLKAYGIIGTDIAPSGIIWYLRYQLPMPGTHIGYSKCGLTALK